jgi:hypothetical protein
MPQFADRSLLRWAIAGDVVVVVTMTVFGFLTHSTLDETWRLFVTTLGVLVSWALVAPWFDAFSETTLTRPSTVWKIALAATIASPFAAFLRGLILGVGISATFVLVLIATNGPVLTIWRAALAAYFGANRKGQGQRSESYEPKRSKRS